MFAWNIADDNLRRNGHEAAVLDKFCTKEKLANKMH